VQRYIAKPLLIDGLKFDLRVYVLVTSVSPLRAFLLQDGLVRLATAPYVAPAASNLGNNTMHLTNYSINKDASGFVDADDGGVAGSKRSIAWLRGWLRQAGHNPDEAWSNVAHLLVKMLLAAQPKLAHVYHSAAGPRARRGHDTAAGAAAGLQSGADVAALKPSEAFHSGACWEILGCDIMFDSALRPWLIEVNHSPSLTCDASLDRRIKARLVRETLGMANVKASDRRKAVASARSKAQSRLLYGARASGGGVRGGSRASSSNTSHGGSRPGSALSSRSLSRPGSHQGYEHNDDGRSSSDAEDGDGGGGPTPPCPSSLGGHFRLEGGVSLLRLAPPRPSGKLSRV